MAATTLVGLLLGAWDDLARVLADTSDADAIAQVDGGSSFAWTVAHLSNQVDAWVNVRFAGQGPHPFIGQERWRTGGSGAAEDWPAIRNAADEVQAIARKYLTPLTDADLDRTAPYTGRIAVLHGRGVSLRYSVARTVAHHYFHIGEIATIRSRRLGHSVGGYPGALSDCF